MNSSRSTRASLVVVLTLAFATSLAACGSSTQGSASAGVTLAADTSCRVYLTASKDVQDEAVKRIAVAQNDSVVLTPEGRPRVDHFCGTDDGLTLGGAIAHAGHELSKSAAAGSSTAASRSRASAVAVVPHPTKTVTATVGRSATSVARPASRGQLRVVFDSAIAVDPEPYMGAHPNVYFTSPSQNIGCYIFDEDVNRVECMISRYDFPQPGRDCDLGAIVSIESYDYATQPVCASTQLYADPADVLEYGQSITNGSMACVSASAGISCLDLETDRGFTLSREQYLQVN